MSLGALYHSLQEKWIAWMYLIPKRFDPTFRHASRF